jgi:hypothetical protein
VGSIRQAHAVVRHRHGEKLLAVVTFGAVSQQPDCPRSSLQPMLNGVRDQLVDHQRQRRGEVAGKLSEQP